MAGWRVSLIVLALSAPFATWASAPETSIHPRARPLTAPGMVAPQSITDAAVTEALRQTLAPPAAPIALTAPITREAVAQSLIPRARPSGLRAPAVQTARATRVEAPREAGPVGRGLCGVPGLTGRTLPRITSSTQGCGIAEPVSVTAVQGIPLSMAARLDCDAARALDRWVREQMIPAIGNRGGGLARIQVIGEYSCRPRNNVRGARISEHGRGRAIDIAGYRLVNGENVTVLHDYRRGPHSRALHRMHDGACGIFRTTLSPDSDRFHQDHLHLDVAQYRGGGTYCH